LARQRTVITIAHRASTLRRSDAVICLVSGRVAEQGNYDELMRQQGAFWRLMERQRTAITEETTPNETPDTVVSASREQPANWL
jgi:ABC-type transport system involved in cytochrome bd biosynthesis fused ATPase/permease subunit